MPDYIDLGGVSNRAAAIGDMRGASKDVQAAMEHYKNKLDTKLEKGNKFSQMNNQLLADQKNFIKFMEALFKYQDPSDPIAGDKLAMVMAQFSQAQVMMEMGKRFDDMIENASQSQMLQAAEQVGKSGEVKANVFHHSKQKPPEISYVIPADAERVAVVISKVEYDDSNPMMMGKAIRHKVVRNIEGKNTPGRHSFSWDGKDNQSIQQADGSYSVQVFAFDKNGKPLRDEMTEREKEIPVYIKGIISGATLTEGNPSLMIGEAKYPLTSLVHLQEASREKSKPKIEPLQGIEENIVHQLESLSSPLEMPREVLQNGINQVETN